MGGFSPPYGDFRPLLVGGQTPTKASLRDKTERKLSIVVELSGGFTNPVGSFSGIKCE